jgi:hypothetical protein
MRSPPRLGVVFDEVDTHGQAEITGVPAGLSKSWSKRAAQIQPEAAGKIAEYEQSLGRTLTLAVGGGHVRNGDRRHVIDANTDGLLVEDIGGRGRTRLPAAYVAAHAEYGWAATIDAAQGATVDVGILLARPGLDRERLYAAMTRGRQANHTCITLEPTTETDHHAPTARSPKPTAWTARSTP